MWPSTNADTRRVPLNRNDGLAACYIKLHQCLQVPIGEELLGSDEAGVEGVTVGREFPGGTLQGASAFNVSRGRRPLEQGVYQTQQAITSLPWSMSRPEALKPRNVSNVHPLH